MKKILRRVLLIVCLSALPATLGIKASAQDIALKTNTLMWAALTPNLGCEIVTGEHSSIDISAFGHKNPYGLTSEIIAVQPEFRYWFNGRPMIREFIGVGALFARYDMVWKHRWLESGEMVTKHPAYKDGYAGGLGFAFGYVFILGRKFNLELSGSFGLMYYNHVNYFEGQDHLQDNNKLEDRLWGLKLFPFDVGVTFSYIIK